MRDRGPAEGLREGPRGREEDAWRARGALGVAGLTRRGDLGAAGAAEWLVWVEVEGSFAMESWLSEAVRPPSLSWVDAIFICEGCRPSCGSSEGDAMKSMRSWS